MNADGLKYISFISLYFIFHCKSWGQLDLSITKLDTNIYAIKIFNSSSAPIGIRCSPAISQISEKDTLELKIPEWYNGNGQDYYYDIDFTTKDLSTSEGSIYSIFILSAQSYLITNIRLTDYSKYKIHNLHFGLTFTRNLTEGDTKTFSKKE